MAQTPPGGPTTAVFLAVTLLASALAPALAPVGPVVAETGTEDPDPELLQSGGTFWAGQRLHVESVQPGDEDVVWEVRNLTDDGDVGGRLTVLTLNESGEATLDTDLHPMDGGYVLVDDEGDTQLVRRGRARDADTLGEAVFDVVRQNLSASLDDPDVERGDRPEVTFDSNRASYTMNVTANVLDGEELAAVFEEATVVRRGEEYVWLRVRDVGDSPTEDLNISDIPAGYHQFTFRPTDSTAVARVTFRLRGPAGQSNRVNFTRKPIVVDRGDVAAIPVDLQRYASATLVVGDADGFGYEATVDVRDGDGDGRVTVLFNTSNAGASEAAAQEVENEEVYLARGSEDDVRLTDETALPGGLAAADYPVDATLNGTAEAAATLVVEPRETVGLRAYTAPREADLENRSTVVAAASPSDTVAVGDYLVAEVTVTGVYGYVTETADLSENGIEVTINQTDVAQNTEAKRLDTADAELFRDPDNDTLYLTKRLLAREVEPDEEYEVEFSVTDENRFVPDGEGEAVSDRVRVTDQSVTVDRNLDEGLVLEPIRGATVTGESTLAPGTELWARMRSEGAETGFYQQRTVEVSPNGTVTIRFDTRAVPLTADLVLTVGRGQTTFDTVEVGLSNDPVSTPTPRPPGGVETPTTPTPPPSPTPIPSPTPTPTPSPTPSPSPTPTPTPAPSPTDSGPDAGGSPPDGTAAVDGGTGEDGGDGGGGTAGAGGGSTDPAGVFVGAFLAVVAFAAVLAVGVTWGRRE